MKTIALLALVCAPLFGWAAEDSVAWGHRYIERVCDIPIMPNDPCGNHSIGGARASRCAYDRAMDTCYRTGARRCDYIDLRFQRIVRFGVPPQMVCEADVMVEAWY
jgi:hypothetical protein